MSVENNGIKNKRPMRSFEADPDVQSMLEDAQQDGFTITEIVNEALHRHGYQIIALIVKAKSERRNQALKKWSNPPFFNTPPGGSARSDSGTPALNDSPMPVSEIPVPPTEPSRYLPKRKKKPKP